MRTIGSVCKLFRHFPQSINIFYILGRFGQLIFKNFENKTLNLFKIIKEIVYTHTYKHTHTQNKELRLLTNVNIISKICQIIGKIHFI